MAINEVNTKKEEKTDKKVQKTKGEKYVECSEIFGLLFLFWLIVNAILTAINFNVLIQVAAVGLLLISGSLTIIFIYLSSKEIKTETEREKEREYNKKESLINKLNKREFKEIKLEKTENRFFNAFLNNKIEAMLDKDNDEIIKIRFCFYDDIGIAYYKIVPFSKEYLIEAIADVVESDSN